MTRLSLSLRQKNFGSGNEKGKTIAKEGQNQDIKCFVAWGEDTVYHNALISIQLF